MFGQIRVLLWKNLTQRKREPVALFFELVLPLLFIGLLAFLRHVLGGTDIVSADTDVVANNEMYATHDAFMTELVDGEYQRKLCVVPASDESYAQLVNIFETHTRGDMSSYLKRYGSVGEINRANRDVKEYFCFAAFVEAPPKTQKLSASASASTSSATSIGDDNAAETVYSYTLLFRGGRVDVSSLPIEPLNMAFTSDYALRTTYTYGPQGLAALAGALTMHAEGAVNYKGGAAGPLTAPDLNDALTLQGYLMARPARRVDRFAAIFASYMCWLLVMMYMVSLSKVVASLVSEKESRMRETLAIMGMRPSSLLLSWFLFYAAFMAIIAAGVTIFACLTVFETSSPVPVFLLFYLFGLSVVATGFVASALFDKAKTAASVATVLYSALAAAYTVLEPTSSAGQRALVSLSAPAAFMQGVGVIARQMAVGGGVGALDMALVDQNYSLATALGMLVLDCALYIAVGWYLQEVLPSQYGVRKPWYFVFTCCCNGSRKRSGEGATASLLADADTSSSDSAAADGSLNTPPAVHPLAKVEAPDAAMRGRESIRLRGLRKTFGDFAAVRSLHLDVYEGQLFALLGHNGSGKTTTFNMLSGLYEPSAGAADILGRDIRREMDQIRTSLGVCPQHDVIYDKLTVQEHMYLFGALKGVPQHALPGAIAEMLHRVGLGPAGDNKVLAPAGTLSGGQKRKLSVAIALLGSPRVVLLDECTAGMDVAAQRHIWSLLLETRKTSTIVLSTHLMEEAEICDRAAILSEGSLQTVGSMHFLKESYGVGYSLTMSKLHSRYNNAGVGTDPVSPPPASPAPEGITTASGARILEAVTAQMPAAALLADAGGEISVQIPFTESARTPDLLDAIDARRGELGIASYSVGVTTLTEVFLKVAEASVVNDDDWDEGAEARSEERARQRAAKAAAGAAAANKNAHATTKEPTSSVSLLSRSNVQQSDGYASTSTSTSGGASDADDEMWQDDFAARRANTSACCAHTRALYCKRFHAARRDGRALKWQLVLPALIILVAVGVQRLVANAFLYSKTVHTHTGIYPAPRMLDVARWAPATEAAQGVDTFMSAVLPQLSQRNTLAPFTAAWDTADRCDTTADASLAEHHREQYRDDDRSTVRPMTLAVCKAVNVPATNPTVKSQLHLLLGANATAAQAPFVTLSAVVNGVLRGAGKAARFELSVGELDLPFDVEGALSYGLIVPLIIAMAFVTASYGYFIVAERVGNGKHLQIISGAGPLAYWTSNLLWDISNFAVSYAVVMTVLGVLGVKVLVGGKAALLTSCILWGYVVSMTPFIYLLSWLFTAATSVMTATVMITYFGSVALNIVLTIYQAVADADGDGSGFVYRLPEFFPPYAMGRCFFNMVLAASPLSDPTDPAPHSFEHLKPMAYAVGMSVVSFVLVFVLERKLTTGDLCSSIRGRTPQSFNTPSPQELADMQSPPADSDVAAERHAILAGACNDPAEFPIVLRGLRKVYPSPGSVTPLVAVSSLFYSVKKGEVFGFLGANACGKTTTMKMLTGHVTPNDGSASLAGYDVRFEQGKVRERIGYCPQFDAILPQLTGREHLQLYARIKLVPEHKVAGYVSRLLEKLTLADIADKPAGTYSGGNKRKLSVGIALIGGPPLVFLDEPTTGCDPAARRAIWKLISSTMANRSVILTSHSMEEVSALTAGGRIAIMARGKLQCLGSASHLKTKFGDGYQVSVKVVEGEQERVAAHIAQEFPGAALVEIHGTAAKFSLPLQGLTLAAAFRRMEAAKAACGILSYSVSHTDLDSIFIKICEPQQQQQQQQQQQPMQQPMQFGQPPAGYGQPPAYGSGAPVAM